jgi:hypothetical protein
MTLGIRPPRRPTRIKLKVEPYDIAVLATLGRIRAPAPAVAPPETPRVRASSEPRIPVRDE